MSVWGFLNVLRGRRIVGTLVWKRDTREKIKKFILSIFRCLRDEILGEMSCRKWINWIPHRVHRNTAAKRFHEALELLQNDSTRYKSAASSSLKKKSNCSLIFYLNTKGLWLSTSLRWVYSITRLNHRLSYLPFPTFLGSNKTFVSLSRHRMSLQNTSKRNSIPASSSTRKGRIDPAISWLRRRLLVNGVSSMMYNLSTVSQFEIPVCLLRWTSFRKILLGTRLLVVSITFLVSMKSLLQQSVEILLRFLRRSGW